MGQLGKDVAQVTVESGWWSRINWTQGVAWVCSGLAVYTAGKFDVSPAVQTYIVMMIQGLAGLLTIWFRHTTTTITAAAAAKLAKAA